MAKIVRSAIIGLFFCGLAMSCGSENSAQMQTGVAENGESFRYGQATTLALSPVESIESQNSVSAPSSTAVDAKTTQNTAETTEGSSSSSNRSSGVPLIIYDTDMGPDIDDAPGLAMLHGYETDGKAELAAVTVSRQGFDGAQFSDALNTFYGRPDVPVGIYKGSTGANSSQYTYLVDSFPHDLSEAPDGFKVQRQVLADAEKSGRKVIMIQVGFSSNISELLNSRADEISDKSGLELVENNVSLLSIMAGAPTSVEFNIKHNLPAAENLFAKWPVDMVVSYWDTGGHVYYPYSAIQKLPTDHIVRQAYEVGGPGNSPYAGGGWHEPAGDFYNMRSWDLTSVLHALEPERDYFGISSAGTVRLEGGVAKFSEGDGGRHYILSNTSGYSAEQKNKAATAMAAMIR